MDLKNLNRETQLNQKIIEEIINLYKSGKLDEAESEAQNLLKQFPDDITCLNVFGVILDKLK